MTGESRKSAAGGAGSGGASGAGAPPTLRTAVAPQLVHLLESLEQQQVEADVQQDVLAVRQDIREEAEFAGAEPEDVEDGLQDLVPHDLLQPGLVERAGLDEDLADPTLVGIDLGPDVGAGDLRSGHQTEPHQPVTQPFGRSLAPGVDQGAVVEVDPRLFPPGVEHELARHPRQREELQHVHDRKRPDASVQDHSDLRRPLATAAW